MNLLSTTVLSVAITTIGTTFGATCGWMLAVGHSVPMAKAGDSSQANDADEDASSQKSIWQAARDSDLAAIEAALQSGVDIDAKTEYGATALFFACDRGHEEIVRFLLENGADPNAKDTFYQATPMMWAKAGNKKIVLLLLANGGEGADTLFLTAISGSDADYAKAILATGALTKSSLVKARNVALQIDDPVQQAELLTVFAELDLPEPTALPKLTADILKQYEGRFRKDQITIDVAATDLTLKMGFNGGEKKPLVHVGQHEFIMDATEIAFDFQEDGATTLVLGTGDDATKLIRHDGTQSGVPPSEPDSEESSRNRAVRFPASTDASRKSDLTSSSPNWPGFRGRGARGIAEGQNPPTTWNAKKDEENGEYLNLLWKSPIPGLGLSCPTIWGNHLYLTSAVSEGDDDGLRIGLYGDVASIEDDREYEFKVYCYDKQSGRLIWEKTANKAKPAVKRHAKSSHANPTVATNGEQVIAFFGSEGLYCYSSDGDALWKRDLGLLDSGWFYDPGYQWGFGSSPRIYKNLVVVQCDTQDQSFVAAFDLKTGKAIWRSDRDEIPTWSSPTVHEFGDTAMLITGGTKSARGYDVSDGQLLWSLSGHSEIVVPTPFVAHNLIFLASGYSPIQPIYAIHPSARGEIRLEEHTTTHDSISWSRQRGGPYLPSPIVYGDYLYCCSNSGILTCYLAKTGERVYKQRIKASGGSLSFTASPVAADGHLFLTAEDGRVIVVKAGPDYEIMRVNQCGESVLATPAISEGVIYFRTEDHLIAIGQVGNVNSQENVCD